MSTNEIIIKTLFREVSAHVGQDDLTNAQRLLDRAARKYGHNPEVERFLTKLYRNLGLERPVPEQDIDLPDMPSDDDLAFLAEQEAIHREEEFVIAAPPAPPTGRKKLGLKRSRADSGDSTDGPKIVYRSWATKSAFESSAALPESTTETPTEAPPWQGPATTGESLVDTDKNCSSGGIYPTEAGGTHGQASPDHESAPQLRKSDAVDPSKAMPPELSTSAGSSTEPGAQQSGSPRSDGSLASPAPSIGQAGPSEPAHHPTGPEARTPLSSPAPDEDEDGDEEPLEREDWEQGALIPEDDDLAGDEFDDEQSVDDPISPNPVDTDKEFSLEDLLALDEWDDSAEEEDGRDDDLDLDALGLEERLTLEERGRQIAINFLLENDLEHNWLDFLSSVFTKRSWGAVRNAMQWAVDRDISLEQLMLARELRALWHERQDYWINFSYAWARAECAEATHQHLSWRFAIRLVATYESVPSIEEVESSLEHEYEYWLNHSRLRRAYPAFLRYLTGYRFSTSSSLLPPSFGWHFEAEEWNEPAALSLEPDYAYDIDRQMAELGVDLTSKNSCKSYAFSDIPMDTLLKRFEKPEKDGEKPVSGKNAKPNKKKQTVRRTPNFLLEETAS